MSFATPLALLALLVVPLLLAGYLWQLRRKRKQAVRFSDVALVRAAVPKRSRWKRHIPVALFLASIAGLAVAAARPQMSVKVPLGRTSVILALDVSRSMCATDVQPNRLAVAQEAARTFVKDQVAGTRIGIVAFAGFAELIVPPTTDRQQLTDAIDNLTTARGTVIGAAELKAIDAIAAVNPDVAPVGNEANGDATTQTPSSTPPPTKNGDYVPDIVVLLTDGANTRGIDPVQAAQVAAERKVRIYTIGFGTTNPTSMVCTRSQLGADVFNEGGFAGGGAGPAAGGFRQFLVIDEPTLMKVADVTGGKFYKAEDANQLRGVFQQLPHQVELQTEKHEISVWFAIIGAALALAAIGLSLLWNRFP
ncbi:MAG TPA: VWA domain-containing protein [Acidimicrobiales bacterium]